VKYSFFDIHPESAHPAIVEYLLKHNLDHYVSPEKDAYAQLGEERIKKAFGLTRADIYYMPNGTITNVTALSSMLKPFEGVICPASGHINNYETGALEATGRKIISVNASNGKLTPELIDEALSGYKDHNNVTPRTVYLTQVTETGAVYSQNELETIIAYAKDHNLYTYLDGARLAMAISHQNITPEDFGGLDLDMFYIGGTKNGGMYGEALVVKNDEFKRDFASYRKRQGADMGKQRFMSLQFARFFDEDGLWLRLAEHANELGLRLRDGLEKIGVRLMPEATANHAFLILENKYIDKLEKEYGLSRWEKINDKSTKIRLVCGWSTTKADVDGFLEDISMLLKN